MCHNDTHYFYNVGSIHYVLSLISFDVWKLSYFQVGTDHLLYRLVEVNTESDTLTP